MIDPSPVPARRIFFVNRFAWPDHSATSQILTQVSEALADQGHEVHIITSRARYSGGGEDLAPHESSRSVRIHRTWTSRFGRSNLAGRVLDYLSFYGSSFFSVMKRTRRGDLVIAKTDPPLLGISIGLAAGLKGASRANWLQDLYPEVAAELGVSLARGPIGRGLKALRNHSLNKSDLIITIGSRMKEGIISEGISADRIAILPNFARDDEMSPSPPGTADLRREWGFDQDDFIIGYSGNLGRAHDHETLLDAAGTLHQDKGIKFLFVGGGHANTIIEEAAWKRNLRSFSFRPYQPESRLAQSLSVPDVHWVSLKPSLEGLIVPSKFYGIAAVARPVIMIGDPEGEIGRIVKAADSGAVFAPGDWRGLAAFLEELKQDPDQRYRLGQNARAWLDANASRQAIFRKWADTLSSMNQEKT
ncbi:glycosyltransferase family 4 protein [Hyphomonas sp. CY54-11-8]|uniref:glycosyltransferase family 4 protein n=1 Tax=Hyphomonas sp. CY54-11-8 TaxID=1280944 RepID=UPI000458DAA9|nr:glycosyltransferase family 4 protein [Hyphomonas sp. CY54-11-8]KCZ47249.1 hypothetical protein HY17_19100 [Hyphomonas sp. CY54-11-8]